MNNAQWLFVLFRLFLSRKIAKIAKIAAPPILKIQNDYPRDYKSELEAAKKLFTSDVPFTDQELAEHKINGLRLREDSEFVRRKLKGIYGEKRLTLVIQYFDEWQKGSEAETNVNKIENAGRYRANTWLRDKSFNKGEIK